MKTATKKSPLLPTLVTKFRLMFLFIILNFTGFAQNGSQNYLNKRITLSVKDEQITKVISTLQNLIPIDIIYNPQTIQADRSISFSVTDQTFKNVLNTYFLPLGIYYKSYVQALVLYHYAKGVRNFPIPKSKKLVKRSLPTIGEPDQ